MQPPADLGELKEFPDLTGTWSHSEPQLGRIRSPRELDDDPQAGAVHELDVLEVDEDFAGHPGRPHKLVGQPRSGVEVYLAEDVDDG